MDGTTSANPERLAASIRKGDLRTFELAQFFFENSINLCSDVRNKSFYLGVTLGCVACALLAAGLNASSSLVLASVIPVLLLAQSFQARWSRTQRRRTTLFREATAIVDNAAGEPFHTATSRAPQIVSKPRRPTDITEAHADALAQLTARISHDLRTPLNAVIGFSELMSNETFGPLGSSRYQDYANHIRESGQSLLKSAEDTLAITSALANPIAVADLDQASVDMRGLLEEAAERVFFQAAQKQVIVEFQAGDDCQVIGESRSLRQVFVNLLVEAFNRSRPGARILVRAESSLASVRVEIVAEQQTGLSQRNDSLPLSVARALLEIYGTGIELKAEGNGIWLAGVELEAAAQKDLFGSCAA